MQAGAKTLVGLDRFYSADYAVLVVGDAEINVDIFVDKRCNGLAYLQFRVVLPQRSNRVFADVGVRCQNGQRLFYGLAD